MCVWSYWKVSCGVPGPLSRVLRESVYETQPKKCASGFHFSSISAPYTRPVPPLSEPWTTRSSSCL